MPMRAKKNVKHDAAEAFYGQSEHSFDKQLEAMGAMDPRLVQAFKKTRERYLMAERSKQDRMH